MTRLTLRGLRRLSLLLFASYITGCASVPKTPPPPPPLTSAATPTTTIVAIAPPATASCTLPQFLGLNGIAGGIGGVFKHLGSRLANSLDLTGRFPGLQPQPPLLALTDAANLSPTAPPAVQAAAEVKAEEDAAPQKIMAIRYLATIGCGGCYEKVEDALLEGMSDCTEAVRYEAVKALECRPDCGCKYCNSSSCCSLKVRARLNELTTCEKEPSTRIRRAARIALACCSGKPIVDDEIPREGPPQPAPPLETPIASYTPTNSSPANFSTANASASRPYDIFSGIELVSFETSAAPASPTDALLAQVNGEPIYESNLLPLVESKLRSGNTSFASDAQARQQVMASELKRFIDWKLLEQGARYELAQMLVRPAGMPLSISEVQAWYERKVQVDPVVPFPELIAFYQVHRDRYQVPPQVRWERITVLVDQCESRQHASAIATYLKNRSAGGKDAPPSELSRTMVDAQNYDWTELNKIEPATLRASLKALQAGKVSAIIDSGDTLNMVRVLERREGSLVPLPAVADQITAEILSERRNATQLRFLAQAHSQSKIWTVFDGTRTPPPASSEPISLLQPSAFTSPLNPAQVNPTQHNSSLSNPLLSSGLPSSVLPAGASPSAFEAQFPATPQQAPYENLPR